MTRSLLALPLVFAATVAVASARAPAPPAGPLRAAVVVTPDATPAAIDRAQRLAGGTVVILHVGGAAEARGQAAQLAARGEDVVAAAGADARAAIGEARAADPTSPVRWIT